MEISLPRLADNVSDGRIVEFVGENYDVTSNIDLLLRNYDESSIPSFSGAILQYDVNYQSLISHSYVEGQLDGVKKELQNIVGSKNLTTEAARSQLQRITLTQGSNQRSSSLYPCDPPGVSVVGVPSGLGPDCVVTFLVTSISDGYCVSLVTYNYISHTCPSAGSAGSGSGSGNGSGSGGGGTGGPPYGGGGGTPFSQTISNDITDPCLSQTISKTLAPSTSSMNLIADIIADFDRRQDVELRLIDSITPSGRPGEIMNPTLTKVNNIPTKFTATVVLHEDYMPDVSQEGAVAIFIHEVMHAYLSESDLIASVQTDQHQTMATKFVDPMADYLQGLFDISEFDAFSLAWSGLTYTGAYTNVASFEIGGATYSKADIIQASAKYMGRGVDGNLLSGTELCEN